jgi:2,3,4,5-tetrahydropyridine-2-carboxylate N-succinyltransferase
MTFKEKIEAIFENDKQFSENEIKLAFTELTEKLNSGELRSAEPLPDGSWQVNIWIKKGILSMFRLSTLIEFSSDTDFKFYDKNTLPLHPFSLKDKIRIVPGGSSIRTGCYVASNVICMPPMYINIGSYVDEGTMIDSHALVGTCAQVGKGVHLSAASQVGGVLEPPGARPVIIEDDVMIGGNCGIYEGILIRRRAVLGSGVILTSSTKVFDLVNERVLASSPGNPLEIPESAVVIPGMRTLDSTFAKRHGLSISSPIIIKYRDAKTDSKTALEQALR